MLNNLLLGQTAEEKLYVEDVFSTYLYTGNSSTQTITNGIDLAGKGGMVWIKQRTGTASHYFQDTSRGITYTLSSDTTSAQAGPFTGTVTSTTSNGFSLGTSSLLNGSGTTYASWTFRKAPKFFDVVTYTGNGTAGRTISHSLGVAPGMIIVKRTDTAGFEWAVYHQTQGANKVLFLEQTSAALTTSSYWNNTTPTSTNFTVAASTTVNANGGSYVAYLFAHDATADGIVQCGSYTGGTDGSTFVNLGWEPQFLLLKKADGNSGWALIDNMRNFAAPGNTTGISRLIANMSDAEVANGGNGARPSSTGFYPWGNSGGDWNTSGATYIYLAIRRGPMRTPTDATKVFATDTFGSSLPTPPAFKAGFPVDLGFYRKPGAASDWIVTDRLRGTPELKFNLTNTETANSVQTFDYQTGYYNSTGTYSTYRSWMLRRAPGFFDVVCYTGTGSARTVSHNLGVAPELVIVKSRSRTDVGWQVYSASLGNTSVLRLNTTGAVINGVNNHWNASTPTATTFSVANDYDVNASGSTYVAYLFASCPGVSKVGSYTGNGSSQNINCGFTNGARFVLIKRTDATSGWLVYDTARGINVGNDPYLLLNDTLAETTTTDYVAPLSTGFTVNSAISVNGGTYIYLAIA